MLGEVIDTIIEVAVKDSEHRLPEVADHAFTDNMAEMIEKLIIVHIRTWMLEDAVQKASTDSELADLKRKIDICFKQKRPQLIQGINRLFEANVSKHRSFQEDSVKLYKGLILDETV